MSNLRKGSMAIGSTVIIGFVIVSFMFTGYQGFSGSSDTVATVDGTPIKVDEFRNEYQRQLQFYSQFFGGKNLTPKQIKQFKIEGTALKNLINRKLIYNLAGDANITPSKKELAEYIKEQPYFKTNDEFDISKYKALLSANRFTPQQYEDVVAKDLIVRKANEIFANYYVSNNFAKELVEIKKNQLEITGVKLTKDSLQKHVPVSGTEISTYVSNPENMEKVKALFESRKPGLSKPEQVLASHILISADNGDFKGAEERIKAIAKGINPSNFAKRANRYTEDPTGKKKGGDLGWFSKGKMVPEFEAAAFGLKKGQVSAPVKTQYGYHLIHVRNKKAAFTPQIEVFKADLAKELIQREKKDDLKKLIQDVDNQIMTALGSKNLNKVESLRKKYGFEFKKSHMLSRIGTQGLTLGITNELVDGLFQKFSGTPIVERIEKPTYISFVLANKLIENKNMTSESEQKTQNQLYVSKFRKEATEVLEKSAKIKTFAKF